jgi:hypothetical protein
MTWLLFFGLWCALSLLAALWWIGLKSVERAWDDLPRFGTQGWNCDCEEDCRCNCGAATEIPARPTYLTEDGV